MPAVSATVLLIFFAVYAGMILGRVPGLALDRTGVALLGALMLIVLGEVSPEAAWAAMDVPTMGLLFGLMVVSAQFRLGGFYAALTRRVAVRPMRPAALLGAVLGLTAVLSAVLTNDIVCLAMAPVLAEVCARRGLDPRPHLIGLACAANIGSAATLIGNPQNMLIGQTLGLPFAAYCAQAAVPVLLGLVIAWSVLALQWRGRWAAIFEVHTAAAPEFNPWQTAKGFLVLGAVLAGFLFTGAPREVLALGAAGLLLVSRRMHTRGMLGLVDWHLLVLFAGLFVVNHALADTGAVDRAVAALAAAGMDPAQPGWLFAWSAVLSNVVSNVPATMLLLPAATHELAGTVLALSSTFAGNLFIVGSIANIIVVEQAGLAGIRITWRDHARTGVPVTLASLAAAALWLVFLARMAG
jgi:Na+/H+ antiporter NhaD/arsenite permease-like protein